MRKSKLLIPIAVAGLLCAGAAGLQAQPYKLNVELSAKFQNLSDHRVGTSHTVIWTTKTIRVTNKDILSLLEIAYGADFTGDTLALSSGGSGDFVVLEGTNVVQNATTSGFFSGFFDNESDSVSNETLNDNSGSNSGTDFFTASFTYSDPTHTNSFTFGGSEAFHFTFNGHNGHFTESFILTGAGDGDIETISSGSGPGTVILKGSISGHRSGTEL